MLRNAHPLSQESFAATTYRVFSDLSKQHGLSSPDHLGVSFLFRKGIPPSFREHTDSAEQTPSIESFGIFNSGGKTLTDHFRNAPDDYTLEHENRMSAAEYVLRQMTYAAYDCAFDREEALYMHKLRQETGRVVFTFVDEPLPKGVMPAEIPYVTLEINANEIEYLLQKYDAAYEEGKLSMIAQANYDFLIGAVFDLEPERDLDNIIG
jgi:hypothetical protein